MKHQIKPKLDIRRVTDEWRCTIEIGDLIICFTSVAPYEQVRREASKHLQRELLEVAA